MKRERKIFPKVALKFFVCLLLFLVCIGLLAEQFMQRQVNATLVTTSWKKEDGRIKRNNLAKLAGLDEHFPLMATENGLEPTKSGKKHRVVLVADSFGWGDGLSNINDVWWRQTERELERRGYHDVEVIGLGWNGAQTKEQLEWLRDARFDSLKPEAIVIGFVVNDMDMGILPQDYKVIQMFFADDVFRWWLPELTQQFQTRYMNKVQKKKSAAKLSYANQEEWQIALMEGENFRLWQQTVAQMAVELRKKNLPYLYMTLPALPDKKYHDPYYDKAVPILRASGIPVLNIMDDFARDKGDTYRFPTLWLANPANGHPGVAATLYYAQKLVDWLEDNAPQALGEKSKIRRMPPRINDWYPWKTQARISDGNILHLNLPELREMSYLPVGKPNIQVSFERPVALQKLVVEIPADKQGVEDILVETVDREGNVGRDLVTCVMSDNGRVFTVPALPKGTLVNSVRLVPVQEKSEMTIRLQCDDSRDS